MNTLSKKISVSLMAAVALTAPQLAAAQAFQGLLADVQSVINAVLPILAGLALVAFFYGLALYVFKADDEDGQEKGKQTMIAGIVALFLMATIGGIVNYLAAELVGGGDINIDNPVDSPYLP